MQIENWPVDRFVPYARNPRRNDDVLDRMCASIREFGFRIPVVARSDGTVVDGHLRLKAARKLDMDSVPVVLADELSETQVKAFRLLANRSVNWAEWDNDLLRLELEDLKLEDFDIDMIGFTEEELAQLDEDTPGSIVEDIPPEVDETDPVCQPGDLWSLGRHRLLCGDCTDESAMSFLLSGAKINAILTDPPYGLTNTRSGKNSYDIYEDTPENLKALIRKVFPLLRETAPVLALTPGVMSQWLWPRPDWTLAWFCPGGARGVPWGFSCWQPVLAYGTDPYQSAKKGLRPDAYCKTETAEAVDHPCSKPVGVWTWFLERVSISRKDNIYEPFCGSGTTLIACEQTGRTCYGMELSPRYCDVIIRRWENLTGKTAEKINGQT